jgi:hypothetical protein
MMMKILSDCFVRMSTRKKPMSNTFFFLSFPLSLSLSNGNCPCMTSNESNREGILLVLFHSTDICREIIVLLTQ